MITITTVAIVTILYIIHTYFKYKDLPPGPYGIPIVGYAPFLGNKPHEKFKELSLKYGGIFCVNIFNEPIVVVNDRDTINEVLVTKGNTFSGRASMFLLDLVQQKKEIATTDGPVWREQKRFVHKIMREFGLGMKSMESVIMQEVDILVRHLELQNGKVVQINSLFFVPILNVIWGITAGKRFDASESDTLIFKKALDYISEALGNTAILNFMPFLRHIAPDMTGYTKICSESGKIINFIRQEVNLHWNNADKNQDNNDDIISRYIAEIKSRQLGSDDIECPPYDRESLVFTTYDFFDAGTETLNTTLLWGFLCIALQQNVQRKVQEELDSVMGNDLHLPHSLKGSVPYTMATLLEIQRFASVAPLGIPHVPTKDTVVNGFRIKKGTTVITNLWGLHYDEKTWGDPRNFRPERFLDNDGKVIKHESFFPFSAGPRFCVGKNMAEIQLFIFFTTLIHRFSFETNPDQTKPNLEPLVGITLQPSKYSLLVKVRN